MTVQTTRVRQQIPMKLITTDFRLNPQQVFSSDILSRPEGLEQPLQIPGPDFTYWEAGGQLTETVV